VRENENQIPIILFAGNIHHEIVGDSIDERHLNATNIIRNWKNDLVYFTEIVNRIFIGET